MGKKSVSDTPEVLSSVSARFEARTGGRDG